MIYIIGILLLLLVIYFFVFLFNYFKLKDYKASIETCCESIDQSLTVKYDLVNKLLKNIKDDSFDKKFDYNKDDSLYDREDILYNISFEINKYIKNEKNQKLKKDVRELNVLEENLEGLKDFYNTNVIHYNSIFFNKWFNNIFKLLKFENYKSFKLRKLEEYEIFKN